MLPQFFFTLLLTIVFGAHDANPNIRFGMPALAKTDPESSREAFLIARPQYVLSYNAKTRTPNWVSWRLRKEDIGSAASSAFEPDPALPLGVIARVKAHDYDNSGFDRGHMCPAKDRSATPEDSQAVFYMTNIVPQSPASNQKRWERLEDYCRRLVHQGHVLYIACGPEGIGGTGKLGYREEIGRGRKITVPARLWKVILVLPSEDAEPHKNTRVIAVVMPNNQSVDFDWSKYRTSTNHIEKLTGYTFFRDVPNDIAESLRDHVDDVAVHVAAPEAHPLRGELTMKNALDALKQASKALMMPSESDAPFEVFELPAGTEPTPERLRQLARVPKNATVEELTLDNLFVTVPSEDKEKFQKLRQAIEGNLSSVKVYKVGDEAERQVFIVGKTGEGKWAGLKTTVVET